MKILVVNCGSSSLKYQLIDMQDESVVAKGLVERIGMDGSILTHKVNGEKFVTEQTMEDHKVAIQLVLNALVDKKHGVIKDMSEISAVGHRVLHGGKKYAASILIDENVMKAIEECIPLGPLHNPANIMGIDACKKLMPNTPMVAVFDTAFHQTMPDYAYTYAIPYDISEKYDIRKYGFHGTSHRFVSIEAAKLLKKDPKDLKLITCHLGNGASICAVNQGKAVDTTMGLTPLAGLVMGTRCGDIDPAIVPFVMKRTGMSVDEVDTLMNKKSGILGVSGVSSDFRDVEEAANSGNDRAKLALNMYYHKVKSFIGAYVAVLNGADAIIFTAGLGENSATSRSAICNGLSYFGIKIDEEKNKKRGEALEISTPDSKIKVLVIPTNEELMIARDTKEIVENK
ncbi:acetate kinase [Clostridium ljungdahlii]|uniref:Acetate kinase n=1 Tax=Clostridium ljungdahlii (strain ATCC 55383 / DSM 13528 / PETC) TaxID=748727 RepID=D8GRZ3_CLOLD|nr:acetate kinase [Clostridium ljungdahlii]ADK14346.1 acetate kinase [Clostridium ljungdahlii DSM 13528]OAA88235.1 Acetate kinase [Clostridium ljungdahlii DSM 13528]